MPPKFWENNNSSSSLEINKTKPFSSAEKNKIYKEKIEKYKKDLKLKFEKNKWNDLAKVEFDEANWVLNC